MYFSHQLLVMLKRFPLNYCHFKIINATIFTFLFFSVILLIFILYILEDYKSFITRIISQGRFTTSLAAKQLFHTKAENILQEVINMC